MAAGKVGTAYVDTELDPTGVKKGLAQVESETKRRMGGVGADVKKGFEKAFVPAIAGLGAVAFGAKKAIDAASDLGEQVSKNTAVFKGSAPEIEKWSQTTAKSLGVSQRAALEATGTFGNMLVPMGIARDEAATMSKRMVTLGADMASFNNASPEETLDAIRAGLAGETEPLRRFGVFLNEARIAQEALSLGLVKGGEALARAQAATKAATAGVAAAQKERTAAAAALTAANARVAAAEKGVEQAATTLATAQEKVRDSTEKLADTKDRQRSATERLREAQLSLREAQVQSRTAQEELTAARKRAADQLKDLRDAAEDVALGEERAQIGLERARERLAKVTGDSESSELDRREAMLAVREAEEGLEDAQDKRRDTSDKLRTAERRGVEGSAEVLKARQAIRDAHRDEEKASTRVAQATRALADAQDAVRDSSRTVAAAQRDLREAHDGTRKAAAEEQAAQRGLTAARARDERAVANLATAQKTLATAKKTEEKASKNITKQLTAEQKARATYAIILKDTKDAQGDVKKTGDQLAGTQRRLAAVAEDNSAKLGKGLVPAYTAWLGLMEKVATLAGKNTKLTQGLVGAFAGLAAVVIAVNGAMKVYTAVQLISRAYTKLMTRETGQLTAAQVIQAAWTRTVSAVTKAWTAVQWLLNAALSANPIGLVVVALAALVVGLVLAYKHSETFRKIVNEAFEEVTKVAEDFAEFFTDTLPEAFEDVLSWVKRHWPEIAVLLAGPFAPLVALATDAFGIRSALVKAFEAILGFVEKQGSRLYTAGRDVGERLKEGVVNAVLGIGNAVWGVVDNIGQRISQGLSTIQGWGSNVGRWLKDAAVAAIVGIGEGAWAVVDNIWTAISSRFEVIKGWGRDVGNWIKGAVVGALAGIGDGAWRIVNNIWEVLSSKIDLIKGWGHSIGTWLKQGIVNGLRGLGDLIRKLFKRMLPGPLERFIPGGRTAAGGGGAPAPAPAGRGVGAMPTAGATAGGLAGAAPVGYQLRRALSGLAPAAAAAAAPPQLEVRVFIGDTELRGIVRTEVRSEDNRVAQTLLAGAA